MNVKQLVYKKSMWLHLIYYIQWGLVRPRAMRVIRFRTSCNIIMNKVCNNFVDSLYSCCSSLFICIVDWRFSFKMHAKLSILLQSHNIVYQYFTTCNKFSHISLLFVSKKLFHNNTKITYFACWRTWHGDHRPTNDGTKPNNKQRKTTTNQRKAKKRQARQTK